MYPNSSGVQFLVGGEVDDRCSCRPGGFDATGPQEESKYHIYPDITLSAGDVIEARWTDRSGVARSSIMTVPAETTATPKSTPTATNSTPTPDSAPATDLAGASGGWPDAGSTGLRDPGVLKSSGSVSVSTNGAVVENLDIKGSISIDADNVTVRNVRVTNNGAKYLIISSRVGLGF